MPGGITVVDIDDERPLTEALSRFGDTPLIVQTPSGGYHLYYRTSGERNEQHVQGQAIDIRGVGGMVVVPPSRAPNAMGDYTFVLGTIEDFRRLPKLKPSSIPLFERAPQSAAKPTNSADSANPESKPSRNRWLYDNLAVPAAHVDSLDELIEIAHALNQSLDDPLGAAEVEKTARSRWKQKDEGRLMLPGQHWVPGLPFEQLQRLLDCPDAYALFSWLRSHHLGLRTQFAVAAEKIRGNFPGWSVRRIRHAIHVLVERQFLKIRHKGGRGPGDATQYGFGRAAQFRVLKSH